MEKLIAWVEIPTTNFERGVSFYNSILNIQLEIMDFGNEKMAHFPSGEGAIIYAEGYQPGEKGVLISLNVGNVLDNTIELIIQNGGKILTPKTKIQTPDRDYFSIFLDSEGNKVGLYGS